MQVFKRIWNEPRVGEQVGYIQASARAAGMKSGWIEGFKACQAGAKLEDAPLQNEDVEGVLAKALTGFDAITFPVFDIVHMCLDDVDPIDALREYFDQSDKLGAELEAGKAASAAGEGASGTEHERPANP